MKKEKNKHTLIKIIIICILSISGLLLYSRFISTKGLKVKEYKITNTIIFMGLKSHILVIFIMEEL